MILKKARKLFAKSGFEGVSIRDICEKATCNVSAISYHYGSKEELYRECLKEDGINICKLMGSVFQTPENEADFKVKIRMFLVQFFEYSFNNRDLILMISKDVNSKMAMESIHTIFEELPNILSNFFKEAQDKGIIRKELDTMVMGDLLIQPVFMHVLFAESSRLHKNRDVSDPVYRQHIVDQQLMILFENLFP